jgi:3-methyladenine DNA glycosylase/8-oxoguanine DNA glycosylase
LPARRAAVRIPLPPAFDFAWARDFLAARAASCVETVTPDGYARAVHLGGQPTLLTLRYDEAGGAFELRTDPAAPPAEARRLVARMFDLDADLGAFQARAGADPLLGPIVAARPHLRLQQFPDLFEGVVRAIVGQQVSVAGARTVVDRLARDLGEPLPGSPACRGFPAPAAFLEAGPARIAAAGLTRAKTAALLGAAEAVLDGRLDAERLRALSPEEAQAALVALPGIGPWTASYLRMRALGDRDAFPASDLGVLKALRNLLGDPKLAAQEAERRAESWRPWRAYATLHLWQSLG